jgi:branched-chain amino acid transport system permease protein
VGAGSVSHYAYYIFTLGTYFFVYCILGLGYNLQYGLAGIHNVANYIFVAFGAYTAAVVTLGPASDLTQSYILGGTLRWPLPLLVAGLAGALTSAVLGAVFLWRVKHQYQAIVTLVVAQVAWLLVGNTQSLFNGYNGLAGVPQPLATIFSVSPVQYEAIFMGIAAIVAVIAYVFLHRVSGSPLGRTLRAIREDQTVASGFGRNVFISQLKAFIVSGFMAGVGGGLLVEYLGSWTPSGWTVSEGFVIIAALIIGGTANNLGAMLGAFIVPVVIYELSGLVPTFGISAGLIDAFRWITIGALALLFLWFKPSGVLPERRAKFRGLPSAREPRPAVLEAEQTV